MLALLLAIVKAIPAADDLAKEFVAAYTAWKKEQNAADEKKINDRNDALIDAALAAGRVRGADTIGTGSAASDAARFDSSVNSGSSVPDSREGRP